jgi:hypothetical protein
MMNRQQELARSHRASVNQAELYGVEQGVGDDGNPQVTAGTKVDETQDKTHNGGVDHPGWTPIIMGQAE